MAQPNIPTGAKHRTKSEAYKRIDETLTDNRDCHKSPKGHEWSCQTMSVIPLLNKLRSIINYGLRPALDYPSLSPILKMLDLYK